MGQNGRINRTETGNEYAINSLMATALGVLQVALLINVYTRVSGSLFFLILQFVVGLFIPIVIIVQRLNIAATVTSVLSIMLQIAAVALCLNHFDLCLVLIPITILYSIMMSIILPRTVNDRAAKITTLCVLFLPPILWFIVSSARNCPGGLDCATSQVIPFGVFVVTLIAYFIIVAIGTIVGKRRR